MSNMERPNKDAEALEELKTAVARAIAPLPPVVASPISTCLDLVVAIATIPRPLRRRCFAAAQGYLIEAAEKEPCLIEALLAILDESKPRLPLRCEAARFCELVAISVASMSPAQRSSTAACRAIRAIRKNLTPARDTFFMAIGLLGQQQPGDAVEAIRAAIVTDPNNVLRAAITLHAMRLASAEWLVPWLESPHLTVKSVALQYLAVRPDSKSTFCAAVIRAATSADAQLRAIAVEAMCRSRHRMLKAHLLAAAYDRDAYVRFVFRSGVCKHPAWAKNLLDELAAIRGSERDEAERTRFDETIRQAKKLANKDGDLVDD